MNEDALRSITYDFVDRTATLIYEPDSEYDLAEIAEYVDDMSDGRAVRVNVIEGDEHRHGLYRKADGGWGGIAQGTQNSL